MWIVQLTVDREPAVSGEPGQVTLLVYKPGQPNEVSKWPLPTSAMARNEIVTEVTMAIYDQLSTL
jgi:hypothetical protein